jgi:hypothetical protein
MERDERGAPLAARRYLIIFASVFLIGALAFYFGGPILLGKGKIAGCRANHYSDDSYLAYCASPGYGDYEHGVFYFDMDPKVHAALERAEVVFLGNSITQFAFSTGATKEVFAESRINYYLLGFAYFETIDFAQALAPRLPLHPRVAVVNADEYFWSDAQSPPAAALLANSRTTRFGYAEKSMWQAIHASICAMPIATKLRFCGQTLSIFRSRSDGAWVGLTEWGLPSRPPAHDPAPPLVSELENQRRARKAALLAEALRIPRHCLVVTSVPNDKIARDEGSRLAHMLGATYIAPTIAGLGTIDGIHLDKSSAESWSRAFARELLEKTTSCVSPAQ